MKALFLFTLLTQLAFSVQAKTYHRHSLVRVEPTNDRQVNKLRRLIDDEQLDVWSDDGSLVDLLLHDDHNILRRLDDTPTKVIIDDVQKLIENQRIPYEVCDSDTDPRDLDPTQYHDLEAINAWLEDISERCGADCQLINIGTSYEGRDVRLIRIGSGAPGRRAVWLDAGIHAREWIAPAVAAYIIGRLILDAGDPDVAILRETYDWYILPVVNPDGYEYSWTTDRLWRKTRQPAEGSTCAGADGNRNYDFMWGGEGASTQPCSNNYRGMSAASEPEVAAIQDYILGHDAIFELYVSFHSFGQILIYPWGYQEGNPEGYDEIVALAEVGVDAINSVHQAGYTHGRSGRFSGNSMDWGLGAAGILYSYILELRDTGDFGFLLPPQFILPTAEESWAGIAAMATHIIDE